MSVVEGTSDAFLFFEICLWYKVDVELFTASNDHTERTSPPELEGAATLAYDIRTL